MCGIHGGNYQYILWVLTHHTYSSKAHKAGITPIIISKQEIDKCKCASKLASLHLILRLLH